MCLVEKTFFFVTKLYVIFILKATCITSKACGKVWFIFITKKRFWSQLKKTMNDNWWRRLNKRMQQLLQLILTFYISNFKQRQIYDDLSKIVDYIVICITVMTSALYWLIYIYLCVYCKKYFLSKIYIETTTHKRYKYMYI